MLYQYELHEEAAAFHYVKIPGDVLKDSSPCVFSSPEQDTAWVPLNPLLVRPVNAT